MALLFEGLRGDAVRVNCTTCERTFEGLTGDVEIALRKSDHSPCKHMFAWTELQDGGEMREALEARAALNAAAAKQRANERVAARVRRGDIDFAVIELREAANDRRQQAKGERRTDSERRFLLEEAESLEAIAGALRAAERFPPVDGGAS